MRVATEMVLQQRNRHHQRQQPLAVVVDHRDPQKPLAESVRELVAQRTGLRPCGPVRLLTHLRYFGHGFNPVSFYYCFDAAGEHIERLVAEVNNTPWGEQHCYGLSAGPAQRERRVQCFELDKQFHVSPFMGMDSRREIPLLPLPATATNAAASEPA